MITSNLRFFVQFRGLFILLFTTKLLIFNHLSINRVSLISIDCKKKERLGNLYREGKVFSTGLIAVYDHDYHYLAEGAVIPHGIYDLHRNEGYISIGNSHETAEFIADNLLWWWDTKLIKVKLILVKFSSTKKSLNYHIELLLKNVNLFLQRS